MNEQNETIGHWLTPTYA